MPAQRTYLSFGRNNFPRRRQRSEDLGNLCILAGGGGTQLRGAVTHSAPPHWEPRGGTLATHPISGTVRKEGLHPQLSRRKLLRSAARPARPAHWVPGLERTRDPSLSSRARKQPRRDAQPPILQPAILKVSLWAPAYSPRPVAGSLIRSPASERQTPQSSWLLQSHPPPAPAPGLGSASPA